MSRGRKPVVTDPAGWEAVFYNAVGTYVQYINQYLSTRFKLEPLSKHIRIIGGYAFKSSAYKKSGIPVIRISDFSNEQIVLKDVVYYEESDALERYELKERDIVIALTGGTIAKLGIVQKGIGKLYLNQRVGKFEVLNPDEFENEYVYWIARSVQSIIKNLAWGAAIPNVSPKQIEELAFPIPDKKIQKGIVEFLNALKLNNLDDRVYFNKEIEDHIYSLQKNQIVGNCLKVELNIQRDLLGRLRKSFLREAMQGKLVNQDPRDGHAKELLEKIKAKKAKSVKKEKELPVIKQEEVPFAIPENWAWCRLGDIAYIASGSTPKQDAFVPNGIPYFKMYNLKNQSIDFSYKPQYIKREIHEGQLKRSRAFPGDVLMNIVGPPLGKLAIISDEFPESNFNQAAVLIRPYIKTLNDWIFWYLNEMSEIDSIVTKGVAGQDNISVTQCNNIRIPLPPFGEQSRIIKKLNGLMKLCGDLRANIEVSMEQNERLLQQVLREVLTD